MTDFRWTDEAEQELRREWTAGVIASRLAKNLGAKFGGNISRNAVLGKVHRLDLETRTTTNRPVPKRSAPFRPRAVKALRDPPDAPGELASRILAATEATALPNEPVSNPYRLVTLLELSAETCRWPIGDVGDQAFGFCGERPAKDSPYCAHHHRLAHTAPESPARLARYWRNMGART